MTMGCYGNCSLCNRCAECRSRRCNGQCDGLHPCMQSSSLYAVSPSPYAILPYAILLYAILPYAIIPSLYANGRAAVPMPLPLPPTPSVTPTPTSAAELAHQSLQDRLVFQEEMEDQVPLNKESQA